MEKGGGLGRRVVLPQMHDLAWSLPLPTVRAWLKEASLSSAAAPAFFIKSRLDEFMS